MSVYKITWWRHNDLFRFSNYWRWQLPFACSFLGNVGIPWQTFNFKKSIAYFTHSRKYVASLVPKVEVSIPFVQYPIWPHPQRGWMARRMEICVKTSLFWAQTSFQCFQQVQMSHMYVIMGFEQNLRELSVNMISLFTVCVRPEICENNFPHFCDFEGKTSQFTMWI